MNKSIPNLRKKILLTGGSGYIGSILSSKLIREGLDVFILDLKKPKKSLLQKHSSHISFLQSDIRKITPRVFKDVSCVIHLAGISDEAGAARHPRLTKDINTLAAIKLAKKAKKEGVERFIFASSSSVYDIGIEQEEGAKRETAMVFPSGPYSISKHNAEKGLLSLSSKDFSVVILRKATVSGFSPHMRFDLVVNSMVKNVLERGYLRVFNKGAQWRPLISINDVADAYHTALIRPRERVSGHIFNIGFENYLVKDIAKMVKMTYKKYFDMNPKILYEESAMKGRSYRMDTKKANKLMGYTAKISIEDVILDLIKEFKKKK